MRQTTDRARRSHTQTQPENPHPEPRLQRCTAANKFQNETTRQPASSTAGPTDEHPELANIIFQNNLDDCRPTHTTQTNTSRNPIKARRLQCNTR